mgnify:FL=1
MKKGKQSCVCCGSFASPCWAPSAQDSISKLSDEERNGKVPLRQGRFQRWYASSPSHALLLGDRVLTQLESVPGQVDHVVLVVGHRGVVGVRSFHEVVVGRAIHEVIVVMKCIHNRFPFERKKRRERTGCLSGGQARSLCSRTKSFRQDYYFRRCWSSPCSFAAFVF